MSLLGRAIARLARQIGGQLMLELPDDLDPSFVGHLLQGANAELPANPAFALFVRGQRQDAAAIEPQVDLRELAMYRQGSHLAFSFASDNRGMSTYSSVYPLLLSNGFPASDTASGGTGVAGLTEFATCLLEVVAERIDMGDVSPADFRIASRDVLQFLAKAYEAAGNGQSSFAADWWLHVQAWVDSLELLATKESPLGGVALLYGCAGLPAPAPGLPLKMSPTDYIKILRDRWSSPQAIGAEISRLSGIPGAADAADSLAGIDWDEAFSTTSLRSDSIVALVAGGASPGVRDRARGWSLLSETDFKESFVDAKGKLRVVRDGNELQAPWKNAPAVLVAGGDECSVEDLALREVELVVPLNSRGLALDAHDGSRLSASIEVRGARGCAASFEVTSEQLFADGLHIKGTLGLAPSKKSRNFAWIEAIATGQAARYLVDRCDASFLVLRSDEAALWAKPRGTTKKGSMRGPVIWSASSSVPVPIELAGPGTYELAVAWGETSTLRVDTLLARNARFDSPWLGMERAGAKAVVEVAESLDITSAGLAVFQIEVSSDEERPLSPIVAAARGIRPDGSALVADGTLGYLEARLGECLSALTEGDVLGCIVATSTRRKQDLVAVRPGLLCTPDLESRTGNDLYPGMPSVQLTKHPSYAALREAYSALGIHGLIAGIEAEEGSSGLTVSRIPLDSIPNEAVEQLLRAYRELLEASSKFAASDAFWARNPFSVAVYPEGAGYKSAEAVLLSPLHPIRLAWTWLLHTGLREAHDDGANPSESLALVEGTHFPSFVAYADQFEAQCALLPLQVDPRPADLYSGWHASVAIVNKQAAIPEWISGRPFPVDGLSALSAALVNSAIDDFLRVSPQVQSLHIELATAHPSRRSSAMDDGVIAKIGELAAASLGLDGVAGVRVTDSDARLGPIPSFAGISDAFAIARPGFNADWVSVPADRPSSSHITFLEGHAALLAVEPSSGAKSGWLPTLPLRRTPLRSRTGMRTAVEYTLAPPGPGASEFAKTLHAYESLASTPHAIKSIPNPIGVAGRPGWLVAGDFGFDPHGIARAAADQSNSSYVLWDWRPVTTIKANREASSRAQPYFILASLPPALNIAIHDRLRQLSGAMTEPELESRARLLVSTLAERAIGLNTLLSIGHHQATGALGFFFALRSIETWLAKRPAGELRMVIPVDAVDPFLRANNAGAGDGSRRRADLLAVRANVVDPDNPRVVLVPVEIKHYGLGNGKAETKFPLAGEPRLEEHAAQLRSYQEQLEALCTGYRDAAGSRASLMGQRLAAVLDAALQLGTEPQQEASQLLAAVASGQASIELGKGILLWYQAGASGPDGTKASWDEVPSTFLRNDVRVDPAAFDGCFWAGEDGSAHETVREALDDASRDSVPDQPLAPIAQTGDNVAAATAVATDDSSATILITGAPATTIPDALDEAPPTRGIAKAATNLPVAVGGTLRKTLPEAELEKRYAALLAALGEFNVKVERPRGECPYREGPAFLEFAVFPSYGVSVSRIESQLQNLKLRLKLSSEAEIGCSTHKGNVVLTVPKSDEERYFIDAEELWARWKRPSSGFKIPVGEDASGDIVELDLSNSNSPHLLIAGVTGSGKSEALLTILHGATRFYTPDELRLQLIDPKQTELNTLDGLAHTEGEIGVFGEDAIAMLDQAVEEMEERYQRFRDAGKNVRNISEYQTTVGSMARWIIVLDEYADLISDDAERKRIEKCLQRLSQKARAAGIHVIVSTQKPVVQVVNTVVKGNLPGKIALRVNTAMESRVILDETGAEKLVGKGDALIRTGNEITRTQFARYAID